MNTDLLKKLCSIYSASGDEGEMKDFLLSYVQKNSNKWTSKPEIFTDEPIQDSVILTFGKPRTAVFVHMDTVGFMVRYQDQLVPIGSPEVGSDTILVGRDVKGFIEAPVYMDEDQRVFLRFMRGVDTGTYLVYRPDFSRKGNVICSPYLDNRIGIWLALSIMPAIRDGILVFTCGEENGSGSAGFLTRIIYEKFNVDKALIADVTWTSDGISPGRGVVISMKDRYIPRRTFIRQIINIASDEGIKFQLEVEAEGSSDGGEIQRSPYPVNWAFIGVPGKAVHTSREKVDLRDVQEMCTLYQVLLKKL